MLRANQVAAVLLQQAEQTFSVQQARLSYLLQPADLALAESSQPTPAEVALIPQPTAVAAVSVSFEPTTAALPSPTAAPTADTSPTPTPAPTFAPTSIPPTKTATPFAVVKATKSVNVRSGPGASYRVVEAARVGAVYAVSGRNKAGDWIRLAGATERWIAASLLEVTGNVAIFESQPTRAKGNLAQTVPNGASGGTSAALTPVQKDINVTAAASGNAGESVAAVVPAPTAAPNPAAQPSAAAPQVITMSVATPTSASLPVAADKPTPSPMPTDAPTPEQSLPQPSATAAPPVATAVPVLPTPQPPTPTEMPPVTVEPSPATAVPTPFAVVNGDNVNIRSGPGMEYEVVALAANGTTYPVTARTEASDWFRLAGNKESWVSASVIQVTGEVPIAAQIPPPPAPRTAPAPVVSASASAAEVVSAPVITATVVSKVMMINVRSGPGLAFGVVGVVRQGTVVTIAGRDSTGEWIRLAGASERWVTASVLQFSGTPPVIAFPELK